MALVSLTATPLAIKREPSFTYKTCELLRRRQRTPDDPRWLVTKKPGAYALLDRLRVRHAKVRATLEGLDQLTPAHLAEPVVVKPLMGNGSSGVVLLEPDGATWMDRLRGRKLTFDDLIAYERRILKARGFKDLWLLEEPLRAADPELKTPDDFKVYTFQGDLALVVQRRGWTGGPPRYKSYTPDWQPVDTGNLTGKVDDTLPAPGAQDGTAILDLARHISRVFPFPFCRVDTFITDQGVQVGELNSWTGSFDRFDDQWDSALGAMWEVAEQRMLARWRYPAGQVIPYASRWRWPRRSAAKALPSTR